MYSSIWEKETINKLSSLYSRITKIERNPEIIEKIDIINQRLERYDSPYDIPYESSI